jgi:hypothetical protein
MLVAAKGKIVTMKNNLLVGNLNQAILVSGVHKKLIGCKPSQRRLATSPARAEQSRPTTAGLGNLSGLMFILSKLFHWEGGRQRSLQKKHGWDAPRSISTPASPRIHRMISPRSHPASPRLRPDASAMKQSGSTSPRPPNRSVQSAAARQNGAGDHRATCPIARRYPRSFEKTRSPRRQKNTRRLKCIGVWFEWLKFGVEGA